MKFFSEKFYQNWTRALSGKVSPESETDVLVSKGNVLHVLLLSLLFCFSVTFVLVNLYQGKSLEAAITAIPIPFIIIEFFLYLIGYPIVSKVMNMLQVTTVVGLLSMITTPDTGVLAFYVPILLGTQLTFLGSERKYAYIFSLYVLGALAFYLWIDVRIGNSPHLVGMDLRREQMMNFIGAAVASTLEVIFILSVSNRIQVQLFEKTTLLNTQNSELNKVLQSNIESNRLISEQLLRIKKSEQELSKLSLIVTKTASGVLVADPFGRVEWCNDSFSKITGYQLGEIIGKKPKEFLQYPGIEQEPLKEMEEKLARCESVEVTVSNRKKNGEIFISRLEINPIFDEKGQLLNFVSLQRDITNEINQQRDLKQVNDRFNQIANLGGIGIWVWETANNNTNWSDVLIQQYGARREDILDYYQFWQDSVHPDDRERTFSSIGLLMSGESNAVSGENRIVRTDNGEIRYLKTLTIAERDPSGNLIQLIGSSMDITDQKLLDISLNEKNAELQKANNELDKFVYSVSHDLRSPLLSIKGLLTLVFDMPELNTKVRDYLNMAQKSINRLDDTIKEILEYSRNSRLGLVYETFNIREMVEHVFDDHKFIVEDGFRFIAEYEGPEEIFSDKTRMQILLRNIIGNSIKYREKKAEASFVCVHFRHTTDKIILTLSDNGEGIPEKNVEKVFEMFFRGSTTGTGTGLGLYICKQILDKLNGTIEVSSKHHEGSTFVITLPVSANQ
jgi:PAS domain S-box-containing protein